MLTPSLKERPVFRIGVIRGGNRPCPVVDRVNDSLFDQVKGADLIKVSESFKERVVRCIIGAADRTVTEE